ncbi:MAG: hypothetical protein ACYC25_17140, partial [Paludibacter sp.]
MKTQIFLFFVIIVLNSCKFSNNNHEIVAKQDVLATIDSSPILSDTVDNLIKQELYDELNRIYLIRKVTLEKLIEEKVLKYEALKRHITLKALKDSLYENKIT